MSVQIVLPGVLADLTGGARKLDVELPTAPPGTGQTGRDQTGRDQPPSEWPVTGTLAMLLDELERDYPVLVRRLRDETGALRRYVNVYVDGIDVRSERGVATLVGEDAVVRILPATAGG